MEYGELAVNFNETDPAIFLKDSNDNIVRIAGAGANGNIEIPGAGSDPHQPGTSDDRYVEVTGDTMTGQLTLPGGGGATEALQKQEVEALIDASDTADGYYLKLAADAGNQTVASTGTTTFDGLVEAGSGVRVTAGGSLNRVQNGLFLTANADGTNQRLRVIQNSGNKLQIADTSTTSLQPLTINPEAGRGQALSFNAPNTTESLQDGGSYMTFQADQTGATFDGKFSF